MYLEFMYLFSDYFKTLTKKEVIYEMLLPLIASILISICLCYGNNFESLSKFKDNSITVLGILIGFSITIITVITTNNNRTIRDIITEKIVSGKKISLYQLFLINFTYSVVIEVFTVILLMVMPIFINNYHFFQIIIVKIIGYSFLCFVILHVLLLNIRNMTGFYFYAFSIGKSDNPK